MARSAAAARVPSWWCRRSEGDINLSKHRICITSTTPVAAKLLLIIYSRKTSLRAWVVRWEVKLLDLVIPTRAKSLT